jgi:hypothetical protein
MFVKETSFVTAVAGFLSPLELIIWIYVLSQLLSPEK